MSFIGAREHGAKAGSAGVASEQQQGIDRRERLRRLALETIDLAKDPYFMRNHLGQYECRLCLTLHTNEGNYLAHTQGKRHQQNLAKRAARESKEKAIQPAPKTAVTVRKTVKIGKPGYRVTKLYDPEAKQRHLLFQIDYPEIQDGEEPRHRFMSAYEQKREPSDMRYQYILFAVEPYEVIAFKVPSAEVDKSEGKFFSHWDPDAKVYSLNVAFKQRQMPQPGMDAGGGRPIIPPPPLPPRPGPPPAPPAGFVGVPPGPGALAPPPRPPVPAPNVAFPRPPVPLPPAPANIGAVRPGGVPLPPRPPAVAFGQGMQEGLMPRPVPAHPVLRPPPPAPPPI